MASSLSSLFKGEQVSIIKDLVKMCHCIKEYLGKFDLKNTVINIVAGLGLLSFITMFCDFILLNYVSERKIVRQHAH